MKMKSPFSHLLLTRRDCLLLELYNHSAFRGMSLQLRARMTNFGDNPYSLRLGKVHMR